MNALSIIRQLEAKGISVKALDDGKIRIQLPAGRNLSPEEDGLIKSLITSRREVFALLKKRRDYSLGFSHAEPSLGTYVMRTKEIQQAVNIGKLVKEGLVILEGPVEYNIPKMQVILKFKPLVPLEWLGLDGVEEIQSMKKQGGNDDQPPSITSKP